MRSRRSQDEDDEEEEEEETGYGIARMGGESASIRYGRIAQRSRETGMMPFLLPHSTEVSNEVESRGGGGGGEGLKDTSVNIATAFAQAVVGSRLRESEEEEEERSGKETHLSGNGSGEKGTKKRKVSTVQSITFSFFRVGS